MISTNTTARREHGPERIRAPLWLASWSFWLLVLGAGVGLLAHKMQVHRDGVSAGRRTWHLRYEICKTFSSAPRPSWQECLDRADESQSDLVAAREADLHVP